MFFVILFAFFIFSFQTKNAFASLLVIDKDGIITWNVLSDADVTLDIPRHSYIEVRTLDESEKEAASQVSLKKDENKISLVVSSDQKERVLDVTNWDEDLVEVEERPETQKVKIGIKEGIFSITQKGIVALTEFPIIIDSKTAQLSVETPTGNRYLSIFPYDAVEAVLRAKFISRISDNEKSCPRNKKIIAIIKQTGLTDPTSNPNLSVRSLL